MATLETELKHNRHKDTRNTLDTVTVDTTDTGHNRHKDTRNTLDTVDTPDTVDTEDTIDHSRSKWSGWSGFGRTSFHLKYVYNYLGYTYT